jgi:hypothetical protein
MTYPDLSHLNADEQIQARKLLDELNLLNIAISQDLAAIGGEDNAINALNQEKNILVIRQDDLKILKQNAEWKIDIQCNDLKNNKRERKCRDEAVKIVDDFERDLLQLEPYIATVKARLQARIDRKEAKNASLNYKRNLVADSIYELSLLGIDSRTDLAAATWGGIADTVNAAGNVVGAVYGMGGPGLGSNSSGSGSNSGGSGSNSGGSGYPGMPFVPFNDKLKNSDDNTLFYGIIVVVVIIVIAFFVKTKNK